LSKKASRNNDIRTLVKEVKRKHGIPRRSFREIIKDFYIPSIRSFLAIATIVLLFFLLSLLRSTKIPSGSNSYQNLITVLVGISTMIFALAIFVAGSSHEAKDVDKMRVLLKQSCLFPLVVVTILTFIILMFGYANCFTVILITLIGMGTIYSVYNVIRTLLSRSLFLQKTAEVLSDRLKLMIDKEIDKRLGNNILLSNLKSKNNKNSKIMLAFNPWTNKEKNKYYIFTSEKSGVITNIKLDELKKIGELVEEEANKNNYAFRENVIKNENKSMGNKVKEPASEIKLRVNQKRYLLVGFEWPVKENDALILIDKSLIKNQKVIDKLKDLVKRSFVIKNARDPSKEIRKEIGGLGKEFVKAIREKELSTLGDLKEIYIALIETFWEYVLKFGIYSYEEANKERHSLLGKWKALEWISDDYGRFLKDAVDTGDRNIINEVFSLSVAITYRAIDYKDQLIFQEFLQFNEYLYIYAIGTQNEDLKSFATEHICMHLRELGDFYIVSKLEDSNSSIQGLNIFKDFAIYLFHLFQRLLKDAFDKEDIKSFKQFSDRVINLFNNFNPSTRAVDKKGMQLQLENDELPEIEKNKLKEKLKRQEILEKVEEEIIGKRQQMLFGLSSWIFYKLRQDKSNSRLKEFYDTVIETNTNDINELTNTFINSSPDYWGWDSWEMVADGKAHRVQFNRKLAEFFVIRALSILSAKKDSEIEKIELPYNRNFESSISNKKSDLNRVLDDIKSNPDNWKFALPESAMSKLSLFRSLLKKAAKAQEEKDLELKREKPISPKKVEEFKKGVIKRFYEMDTMREIFKYFSLYQNKIKEAREKKENRFGFFNMLDDKAAFFDEWHTYYLNLGENYGRNLASSETSFLVDKITANCTKIKNTRFDKILKKFANPDDVIILVVNMAESWKFLEDTGNFIPSWYKNFKEYKDILPKTDMKKVGGWYKFQGKFIPIFKVFHNKGEESIVILDKSKLGHLVQYPPTSKGEGKKPLKDIFYMDVQDLSSNEKKMEKIIKEKPDWLTKKGGEEEQRKYLQECVIVNIYESFEYQKSKDFNGYVLNFH